MSMKLLSAQKMSNLKLGQGQLDPYWSSVVALLPMNYVGSNTSVFQDESNYRINPIASGNAIVSAAQSKFGGYSAALDGTGDYLKFDGGSRFAFGSGDFTIEFWAYFTSFPANTTLYDSRPISTNGVYFNLGVTSTNIRSLLSGSFVIDSAHGMSTGQWYHIAACRSGSTLKVFVGGVEKASITNTSTFLNGANRPVLGINADDESNGAMNGFIDGLRVTKGVARYTAAFTPPTAEYPLLFNSANDPYISSLAMLVRADASNNATNSIFVDSSAAPHTLTVAGNTTQGSYSPFTPAAGVAYDTATHGGSAYFDGTGDYITLDGSADFAFGTGDWTIEMWYRPTTTPTTISLYDSRTTATDTTNSPIIYVNGTGKVVLYVGAAGDLITGSTTLAANTWYHIAIAKSSGSTKLFINGTQEGSTYTDSRNYTNDASRPRIGANGDASWCVTGYLSNINVIKGTAKYTANFTAPSAPVTAHANTKLLLNFTNAAVRDEVGKTLLQLAGTAAVSTTQSKFGGSSIKFNGTAGDYLKGTYQNGVTVGSGDFAVEWWQYISSAPGGSSAWYGYQDTNQLLYLGSYAGTPVLLSIVGNSVSVPLNQWNHLAICRIGSTVKVFLNGVVAHSSTYTTNITASSFYVGADWGGSQPMNGYIDDFRVTIGAGRYLGNFVPPTAAHPNT